MLETRWILPAQVEASDALRQAVGGHELLATILARRGLGDPEAARAFLDPSAYQPASGYELPGLDRAVARLRRGIESGDRVTIWGDFDADGQTATALLLDALGCLGANVGYYLPSREESHGLNLQGVERLAQEGTKLLITCDTGVTADEEVGLARQLGVDCIITDHHDLAATLPVAEAVVNPKMLDAAHPLRELTGVGCAFKVAEALNEVLGVSANTTGLLDLVAVGMVADVASLVGDVRYLTMRGLIALQHARRVGLRALLESAGLDPAGITAEHIGYVIAPRLNALGRLGDASLCVELLTTQDLGRARVIATMIEQSNDQRKLLVKQVLDAAEAQIQREGSRTLEEPVLVLAHASWPEGVIGIVAGRLAERYGRPAVLIAEGRDGFARGSARSVAGRDIHAAIAEQADLLERYGGHPMAAGFSLAVSRLPEFRQRLAAAVARQAAEGPRPAELVIDAYVQLGDLSLELARDLARLGPFGPGNPAPCLVADNLELVSQAIIGRTSEHRRLVVRGADGQERTALQWHGADTPLPEGRFDLAFSLRASDYQGRNEVQIEWIAARELEPTIAAAPKAKAEVVDLRSVLDPVAAVAGAAAGQEAMIWAEGLTTPPAGARDRALLGPAAVLAIWSIPPGPSELRRAMAAAASQRILLLAIDPGLDEPGKFVSRLLGLVKHTLASKGGKVALARLAAAMAHREETVLAGLRLLQARGQIVVGAQNGDLALAPGDGSASPDTRALEKTLLELLSETAAYRRHYRTAPPESLLGD